MKGGSISDAGSRSVGRFPPTYRGEPSGSQKPPADCESDDPRHLLASPAN